MVYLTSLTNTIGKTKELKTKNIFFTMQCQELLQDKKWNNNEPSKKAYHCNSWEDNRNCKATILKSTKQVFHQNKLIC
jgi:hypothetical protein